MEPIITYKPGLHVLAEFTSALIPFLNDSASFREFLDNEITGQQLQKVGEVYHDFEGGGFTAVVCLTESHISIHTWPEHGLATFDVFLSNYMHVNDGKARAIYQSVMDFYQGVALQKTEVKR